MFMTHSRSAAAPPPSFAFLLLLQLELGAARRALLSHVRPSLLWRSLWPRRCLEHEDSEGADTFGPIVSNIANRVRSAAEMSAADSFARTRPEARMLADAVREGSCVWYRVDPLTSERPHEGIVNKLAPDAAVDAMGAPLALCDGYRGNAREAFAAATSVECARCPAEAPNAPYNVLQCDARGGQQVLRRDQHDIGAPPASPKARPVTVLLSVSDHTNHGLFAQIERVLNQLRFAAAKGYVPAVHLGAFAWAPHDSCDVGPNAYHSAAVGPSVWEYLFEPVSTYRLGDETVAVGGVIAPVREVRVVHVMDLYSYGELSPPVSAYFDFHSYDAAHRLRVRALANRLVHQWLRPRPEVLEVVSQRVRAMYERVDTEANRGAKLLGVHLRGTDKTVHPRVEVLPFAELATKYLNAHPGSKVFVATDDPSMYREFIAAVGSANIANVGEREEHTPMHLREGASTDEKDVDWRRVLGTAAGARAKAAEALVDALVLSHCDFLLKSSSALSEFAIWYNLNLHEDHIDLQLEGDGAADQLRPAWADSTKAVGSFGASAGAGASGTDAGDQQADGRRLFPLSVPIPEGADGATCRDDDVPIATTLRRCPYGYTGDSCEVRLDSALSYLPPAENFLSQLGAERRTGCQARFWASMRRLARDTVPGGRWPEKRTSVDIVTWEQLTMGKTVLRVVAHGVWGLTHERGLRAVPAAAAQEKQWRWTERMDDCNTPEALEFAKAHDGERWGYYCFYDPPERPVRDEDRTLLSAPPGALDVPAQRAQELFDAIAAGEAEHGKLTMYAAAAMSAELVARPNARVMEYAAQHLRRIPRRDGRSADGGDGAGPTASVHIRRGDACDQGEDNLRDERGPRNHMFADGLRKNGRKCYSVQVYLDALLELQAAYGVTRVFVATDDVPALEELVTDPRFEWTYLDFPREQLARKGGVWMEFRDVEALDQHASLSIAADVELLARADMFVGSPGSSSVGRLAYYQMVGRARTGYMPPFIAVDGYSLCCDLTQYCEEKAIHNRQSSWQECVVGIALLPHNMTIATEAGQKEG